MAERRCYVIALKGGPYDGAPGLVWQDDGQHPPPEKVLVGTCPGDGTCQAGVRAHCYRVSRGSPHVCYWTEGEQTKPVELVAYPRTNLEEPRTSDGDWTAVYALGPRQPEPADVPDALYVPTEWVQEREVVKAFEYWVDFLRDNKRPPVQRFRSAPVSLDALRMAWEGDRDDGAAEAWRLGPCESPGADHDLRGER